MYRRETPWFLDPQWQNHVFHEENPFDLF